LKLQLLLRSLEADSQMMPCHCSSCPMVQEAAAHGHWSTKVEDLACLAVRFLGRRLATISIRIGVLRAVGEAIVDCRSLGCELATHCFLGLIGDATIRRADGIQADTRSLRCFRRWACTAAVLTILLLSSSRGGTEEGSRANLSSRFLNFFFVFS
jgi:hypothetical protein